MGAGSRVFFPGFDRESGIELWAVEEVHGRELWRSDGTAAGTTLAIDLEPGPGSFAAEALISLGDRLLVFGSSPSRGSELWATDGTPGGTRKISDHAYISGNAGCAIYKDRLYYQGHGRVLWVTDGTRAGTAAVQFPGYGEDTGVELWAVEEDAGRVAG